MCAGTELHIRGLLVVDASLLRIATVGARAPTSASRSLAQFSSTGGSKYKETVFSAPTTSTWHVQATKLHVRAGALELCLENVGRSGSAADHGSYELVRKHRGMGDVWRARKPQKWHVRLLAPFSGEVPKALLLLMQTQKRLSFH